MVTSNRTPQSIFPDYPREQPVINEKTKNFMPVWGLGFSQLFQGLQTNYTNEGIVIPPLNATQAATIAALYTPFIGQPYGKLTTALPDISGKMIYNTTINAPQIFIIVVEIVLFIPTVITARWWTFTIT